MRSTVLLIHFVTLLEPMQLTVMLFPFEQVLLFAQQCLHLLP